MVDSEKREKWIDLIRRLTEAPGPSGQEERVREIILNELRPYCKEIIEDPLGNLVAKIGPDGDFRVGILAHMDEVGLIITRILPNGLLGFDPVGIIDERCLLGCLVHVMASDGRLIPGVIGQKSRHLQTEEELEARVSHRTLWIDVGSSSREEALDRGIRIGSGVVFATPFHAYENGIILGKALDNRVSCAVLIEVVKALSPKLNRLSLYGMFTIEEEIGAKGASVVAFDHRPRMTLTLDNVPTQNPNDLAPGDVDLRRGPVIRIFDWWPSLTLGMFSHPAIRQRLLEVATKEGIPHQRDVLTATFLDSSQVHLTAGGIPGGSICFPRRYAHSPVEMCDLSDVENGFQLLIKFLESVDENPLQFGRSYSPSHPPVV